MKRKTRQKISRILLVICIGLFAVVAYQLGTEQYTKWKIQQEYDRLAAIAQAQGQMETEESVYHSPIDFDALRTINPEIVAWMRIEGTYLDYPILWGTDNDKYLHTTFSGEQNPAGAIFIDCRGKGDFSDWNTLIHGHNLLTGTMFELLTEYKNQSFYDAHPSVMIYLPDKEYRCEIYSAYETATNDRTYTIHFASRDTFAAYLNYTAGRSFIATHGQALPEENIITLSTCDYDFYDARMVVQARMIE
ncbi:MAG: class B sortase [Peptococcaceae bacterium]|nr:class B sortase [Peptococcaceae bacterium]